jgi:putative ABC transport system substrate-binding protein
MRRRGTALLAAKVRRAHAQQPRVPVIGFLNSESPGPLAQLIATFHQGLNEIGYVERAICSTAGYGG